MDTVDWTKPVGFRGVSDELVFIGIIPNDFRVVCWNKNRGQTVTRKQDGTVGALQHPYDIVNIPEPPKRVKLWGVKLTFDTGTSPVYRGFESEMERKEYIELLRPYRCAAEIYETEVELRPYKSP